jgi:hypothetical protein
MGGHATGALELRQQVKQHQNAQEGRLGGKELVQTEIVGAQARVLTAGKQLNASLSTCQ